MHLFKAEESEPLSVVDESDVCEGVGNLKSYESEMRKWRCWESKNLYNSYMLLFQ